jgi:superfamily II DNA or RNA helicase
MELRPYQLETVEAIRNSICQGNKRIIVQAPCGAGKTIIVAHIIQKALLKNSKVVFLVHLRQLAHQAIERFTECGMGDKVGVIMAGEEPHLDRSVQVVSVPTYSRRLQLAELKNNKWFKEANLVFYDEAHASIAKTRKDILNLYKGNTILIGLTATPCRADGRGLGEIYDDIVSVSNIHKLTQLGYLVPVLYYGAKELPDLNDIPLVAGDYNKKILGQRVDQKKLVGDILENWLRIAPDRQTVIFAVNVKHSRHIESVFKAHNIAIEHVDAHTPDDLRKDILQRFKKGTTQVVTNVGVYSEGADFPWASCIVLAQPSKSYGRYVQRGGRGLRPYPGKKDCIIIDHSRLIEQHGYLDDDVTWTLDGKKIAWKKKKIVKKERVIITCTECQNLFYGNVCPQCGTRLTPTQKEIITTKAELKLMKGKHNEAKAPASTEDKRRFYGMLLYEHQVNHPEYRPGWLANQYRTKFGVWPKGMGNTYRIEPDKQFLNFLTWQRIKYFKGKGKHK